MSRGYNLMIYDATFTNAISNALHSFFLFFYFCGAVVHYRKGNSSFSLLIVLYFLTLFFLKVLGIYVHYYNVDTALTNSWIAISLLTIMLNYLLVEAMKMPETARIIVLFLSIGSSFLFMTHNGDFIYIALPVLLVYLIAACYSASMTRTGFVMVVIANVVWILTRTAENHFAGHEIAAGYRYDNDIYHLLLIISTFIIYKSIVKGHWEG
jgi:hypothetical protein